MRITSPSIPATRFPWIASVAPLVITCVMWAVTGSPLSLLFGAMSPVMLVAHFVEGRRDARRRDAREREDAEAEHPSASKLIELVDVARRPKYDDTDAIQIRVGATPDGTPVVISAGDGVVIEGAADVVRDVKRAVTAQSWWSRMSTSLGDEIITTRSGRGRWLMAVTTDGTNLEDVGATLRDRDTPAKPAVVLIPDRLAANDLARLRFGIARHGQNFVTTPATTGSATSGSATSATASKDSIGVVVGVTRDGHDVCLDLVRHGPHAVVSGMTGSGKTSFIVAWLSALADGFAPDDVEIAVIDFKGGIDFSSVTALPHCIGVATDTEPGSVDRALGALGIEMRRREELLKQGVPVGRLIVVLDEFRATAAAHPLAVPTVVDLTARGRALGVHVILSTQRAASTISDDILANVPLRVAFRALSAAESRFVVGTDQAHTVLRDPGDAILSGVHEEPVRVLMNQSMVPATQTGAIGASGASAATRESTAPPARQLWAPELPRHITAVRAQEREKFGLLDGVEGNHGACIGVLDVPALQSWRSAWFDSHVDGHLMITGSAGSGRTTALHTVTRGAHVRWVRDGVDLWDVLDARRSVHRIGVELSPRAIVVDALEAKLGELSAEFRDTLLERLTLALRQPSDQHSHSPRFIVSCDADGAWALRLGALFPNRLELVAGSAIPGRARWRGYDLQIAVTDEKDATEVDPTTNLVTNDGQSALTPERVNTRAIALTRTPPHARGDYRESLAEAGLEVIHVASPDEWMRDPGQLATLSADHAVVIAHDVHSADLRLLMRHLTPVPPVRPGESLVFAPDGTYVRVG